MDIMHAMSAPDSGLEIRDRMWLKIAIPNAFIGKLTILLKTDFCLCLTCKDICHLQKSVF